jgi:photosystem II stability/assembly factor-like uncharacterized protein
VLPVQSCPSATGSTLWASFSKTKTMKKLIILFYLLMLSILTFSQWIQQNSNTTKTLRSICFIDENTGFVVGDSGTILKTMDGGSIWTPINSGIVNDFNSIDFPNTDIGFIVGDDGVILKSTDGGITWILNYSHPSWGNFYNVKFQEVNKGYVTASDGVLMRTLDGGSLWYFHLLSPVAPILSASFTDTITGYLVGVLEDERGFIRKTIGGNLTILPESESGLYSVFFSDDSTGYATGMNGIIVRTIDAGNIWTTMQHNLDPDYYSVFFTDSQTGYVAGSVGMIKKTTDGGFNWIISPSGVTEDLREIYFINSDTGYAVGTNGTILKTITGGFVTVNNYSKGNDIMLYPNPASNKIIIILEVQIQEQIKFTISNLYGQKIMEKEFYNQGFNEVDVSSLPEGLHLIKIESKSGHAYKKFIIVRSN